MGFRIESVVIWAYREVILLKAVISMVPSVVFFKDEFMMGRGF